MNEKTLMIGERVNFFTILDIFKNKKQKQFRVKCQCECGTIKEYLITDILKSRFLSCGCKCKKNKKFKDIESNNLIGKKFGSILITNINTDKKKHYNYLCDCGVVGSIRKDRIGVSKSCGCLNYKNGTRFDNLVEKYLNKKINKLYITNCRFDNQERKTYLDYICECGKTGTTLCGGIKTLQSCGCAMRKTAYKELSGQYWYSLMSAAKSRNLEFSITKEDVWNLYEKQNRKCALSGVDVLYTMKRGEGTASVDRIDSKKGYTRDNIQIVHKILNVCKWDLTDQEFIEMCKKVVNFQQKKD